MSHTALAREAIHRACGHLMLTIPTASQEAAEHHYARKPEAIGLARLCQRHIVISPRVTLLDVFAKPPAAVSPHVRWAQQLPIDSPHRAATILAAIILAPQHCLHAVFQPVVSKQNFLTVHSWFTDLRAPLHNMAVHLLDRVRRARHPLHAVKQFDKFICEFARTEAIRVSRRNAAFVTAVERFCSLCSATILSLDA